MPITGVTISHKSQWTSTTGTTTLQGISGDLIETTINFTCTDTFNAIDFLFGLPPNSLQPDSYSNVGYNFAPVNALQQQFTGSKNTTLIPIGNIGWQFGTAVFTDLGSNNYRIVHTYLISPLPQNINDTPSQFISNESVKYVFQVRTKASQYTTTPITTYDSKVLTEQNGNVGYLNEIYNGFAPIYTLENTVASNPNSELVFNIKMTPAQPLPLSVGLTGVRVYDNYDINKNLDDNYKRAFAFVPINGTDNTGQGITKINANLLDIDTIQIKLTLEPNWFIGDDFLLFATVGNLNSSEASVIRNAVFLGSFFAGQIPPPPSCGFVVSQYPNIPFTGFGFVYHNDLNRYWSDVKGFAQDGLISFAKFDLLQGLTLQKIVVELFVATQKPVILERTQIVNTTDTTKGYILGAGDAFNDLEFNFASLELKYSFKLRYEDWLLAIQTNSPNDTQEWQKYPAVFLRVSGYTTNGSFNYIYENVSNAIVVNNFEEATQNTLDANLFGAIELFDSSNNLITNLDADGLTTIKASFNGLNAYNLGVASANELFGIIRLDKFNAGGGVLNIREFSTIRLPELDTPFTSLDTSGLAVLQNYTANTVELIGLIDASKLTNLGYKQNDCIVISARLGRIQPAVNLGQSGSPCCQSIQTIIINSICEPEIELPCNSIQTIIVNSNCPESIPEPPPTNTNYEQRVVSCDSRVQQPSSGTGFWVDAMTLGTGTGEVTFTYNAYEVPDRYILELDGTIIFDSGFVSSAFGGSLPYDFFLTTGKFSQSFIDGYTAYYGSPPPNQLATQGLNGSHKFNKTVNASQTLKIIVYAPLESTTQEYRVDCNKIGLVASFAENLCYLPVGYPFVATSGLAGTFAKNGQNFEGKPVYQLSKVNQTITGTFEDWVLLWRWNQASNVWQLLRSINNSALTVLDSISSLEGTTTANGWQLSQTICPNRFICYSGNTLPNMQGFYGINNTTLYNGEASWLRTISFGQPPFFQFAFRYLASGWRLFSLSPTVNNNVDNRTTNSINIVGLTNNSFSNTDNGTSLNC